MAATEISVKRYLVRLSADERETSVSMVYRVRRQLAEVGLEAVLSRKQRVTPSVPRIFDGEKEAS